MLPPEDGALDRSEHPGGDAPSPPTQYEERYDEEHALRRQLTERVAPMPPGGRSRPEADEIAWKSPPMISGVVLEARPFFTMLRAFQWWAIGLRLVAVIVWDMLQMDFSQETRAKRLREAFQRAGGTVLKLGQQLALRADLLPYVYCEQLGRLLDDTPPMPWPIAQQTIEAALGRPLDAVFAHIEPVAIGSASIACVYDAVLQDGRRVAVKVRRPKIVRQVASDIDLLGRTAGWVEFFGFVRDGFATTVVAQLGNMLAEELDFRREARYAELFRDAARKTRLQWLGAPEPCFSMTAIDVLVMEFVDGVAATDLLLAVDRGDEVALARFRAQGIDPKKVARRMILAWNWQVFHFPVFHGDPHPANMIIQPGNRIVLIDFGACGYFTAPGKRILREVQLGIVNHDVARMSTSVMRLLEPFPPMAIDSFKNELEGLYSDFLFAIESKHSHWWEKATSRIWLSYIRLARKYEVAVTLDTLRLFRATFLMDTVAFRLDPRLRLRKAYLKYLRHEERYLRRQLEKKGLAGLGVAPADSLLALSRNLRLLERVGSSLGALLDNPTFRFVSMPGKVAYLGLVAARLFMAWLAITVGAVALVMIGQSPAAEAAFVTVGDDGAANSYREMALAATRYVAIVVGENTKALTGAVLSVVESPLYALLLVSFVVAFIVRVRGRVAEVETTD